MWNILVVDMNTTTTWKILCDVDVQQQNIKCKFIFQPWNLKQQKKFREVYNFPFVMLSYRLTIPSI